MNKIQEDKITSWSGYHDSNVISRFLEFLLINENIGIHDNFKKTIKNQNFIKESYYDKFSEIASTAPMYTILTINNFSFLLKSINLTYFNNSEILRYLGENLSNQQIEDILNGVRLLG